MRTRQPSPDPRFNAFPRRARIAVLLLAGVLLGAQAAAALHHADAAAHQEPSSCPLCAYFGTDGVALATRATVPPTASPGAAPRIRESAVLPRTCPRLTRLRGPPCALH